jgi:hypothetical protein
MTRFRWFWCHRHTDTRERALRADKVAHDADRLRTQLLTMANELDGFVAALNTQVERTQQQQHPGENRS